MRSGRRCGTARVLNRPFAIEGVVEHGDKGPDDRLSTANIALGHICAEFRILR